jgi:hypothetical protein
MTDRAQFEAMLEALINEDQETAKEIFHNIVVAKSREIYEELLSEDFEASDTGNPYAQEAFGDEDPAEEDDMDSEEDDMDSEEDGMDSEEDDMDDMDLDDEESDDSMDDAEQSDRILDLEDALEELKAEFEQLMAGEDDMGGMDDMEVMPEEGEDMMAMEPMEGDDELMLEYKNKVPAPKHGDNGQNTKSVVAKPNRMGGANLMAGSREESGNGGTKGGLLNPSTKEENFGNVNVPGGNAGKTAFKKKEPGHGAERKSSGDNGDKSAGSPINGLKSRAK